MSRAEAVIEVPDNAGLAIDEEYRVTVPLVAAA
jgi:hypothetical protein